MPDAIPDTTPGEMSVHTLLSICDWPFTYECTCSQRWVLPRFLHSISHAIICL